MVLAEHDLSRLAEGRWQRARSSGGDVHRGFGFGPPFETMLKREAEGDADGRPRLLRDVERMVRG